MPIAAAACEARHELERRVDGRGRRQRPVRLQTIGERPLHQLHRDGGVAVDLRSREHEDAVRMIDGGGEAALAIEALALARIV